MAEPSELELALGAAASDLAAAGKHFALVGGLAVSVRAEPRFTRDIDFAVAVTDDSDAEALVYSLKSRGYLVATSVEHHVQKRLATIRLLSARRIKVDLLFASSGIETETVERATPVSVPGIGEISVARPEELLAMKVLSMTERRLQDRLDAQNLLTFNPELDLSRVREDLRLIKERGFHRNQDLDAKLEGLLATHAAV